MQTKSSYILCNCNFIFRRVRVQEKKVFSGRGRLESGLLTTTVAVAYARNVAATGVLLHIWEKGAGNDSRQLVLDFSFRNQLGANSFQNSFRFAIWKVIRIVVCRSNFNQPIDLDYVLARSGNVGRSMGMSGRILFNAYLDIRYSSNVILRCQNEFIIDNPIRFMVKACWRMELDNLVVLHRQIMTWFFLKLSVLLGQMGSFEVGRGQQ